MAQCTATAKSTGKRCRRHAVAGYTVCQVHGAGSPKQGRPGGRPPVHGRYALKHQAGLQEKQAVFLADPTPGDLTAELALMRALLEDYMERYGDFDDAPLPEHYERLFDMIETITGTVERIHRILSKTALTQAELLYIQAKIADLVNRYIDDPDRRKQFLAELRQAVEPSRRP